MQGSEGPGQILVRLAGLDTKAFIQLALACASEWMIKCGASIGDIGKLGHVLAVKARDHFDNVTRNTLSTNSYTTDATWDCAFIPREFMAILAAFSALIRILVLGPPMGDFGFHLGNLGCDLGYRQ